jgi:biopolymer transport protein ExbD
MFYKPKKRKGPEIMIAPLIDCILFLLFFFIATTVFPENLGIAVEKPKAVSGKPLDKERLVFAVSKEGDYYFGGKKQQSAQITEIIRARPGSSVIVQADRQSSTDNLVGFLDAARQGGALSISIATTKAEIR